MECVSNWVDPLTQLSRIYASFLDVHSHLKLAEEKKAAAEEVLTWREYFPFAAAEKPRLILSSKPKARGGGRFVCVCAETSDITKNDICPSRDVRLKSEHDSGGLRHSHIDSSRVRRGVEERGTLFP